MKRPRKQKISSLQDLADVAGVSRATASRALADSPLISDKTKSKLKELARKHNYTVNRQARDFRLGRTSVISVVFMLDIESGQHMSDPFFLDMLGGIADRFAERDYDLLLAHAPMRNVLDLQDSDMIARSEGVIFIGQGEQHRQLNDLANDGVRMVVWGDPIPDRNYVVVGGANEPGGHAATQHLLELDHRRIGFFGKTAFPEINARFEGYRRALRGYDIEWDPALTFEVPFDLSAAHEAVSEIVASRVDLDAVVCASDVIALATISALQSSGVRVPDDVAVVGYDDIGLAALASPPLTTIRQHIRRGGGALVESVMGLINGEEVADTVIDSELVVRQSSGAGGRQMR